MTHSSIVISRPENVRSLAPSGRKCDTTVTNIIPTSARFTPSGQGNKHTGARAWINLSSREDTSG